MLSLLLAVLCLLFLFLPGCGQENDTILMETTPPLDNGERDFAGEIQDSIRDIPSLTDNPVILRLLKSDGGWNQMFESQVNALIQAFTAVCPDVTIQVSTLTDKNQECILEELQVELSEGTGYDLYRLPTRVEAESTPFPDVNIAMRSGYFGDISSYYDADSDLDTAGLVTEVMDAGRVGQVRYTLPLRFDYPVAYVDMDQWLQAGFDSSSFNLGVVELMSESIMLDKSSVSFSGNDNLLNLFPSLLDYDTMNVSLTEVELTEFLTTYQQYRAVGLGSAGGVATFAMFFHGDHWAARNACVGQGSLAYCLSEASIAQALDINLGMFPITGATGEIAADVTYFGAVGSACAYPEVTYEFLRLLLLPQIQWEEMVPEDAAAEVMYTASGYPVRALDSASTLYRNYFEQQSAHQDLLLDDLSPDEIAGMDQLAQAR